MESTFFSGSKEDFNKFMSSFARNLVQKITKKYKNEIGKCEHCGISNIQLESAHIQGMERKKIMDFILQKFETKNGVLVDLNNFEKLFIEAHLPINKIIKILCKQCYNRYDSIKSDNTNNKSMIKETSNNILNKKKILNVVEKNLNYTIPSDNFNISNINLTGLFTVEPKDTCPNTDWHLCLVNNRERHIYYFIVPKESRVFSNFYYRDDKKRYRLIFETTDKTFTEKFSTIRFDKFLKHKINY